MHKLLSTETGAQVMELMRALNQEHCVVFIVVTHDPAVAAYAQRRIRIHDGRLMEGGADDLVDSAAQSSS